MLPSIVPRIQQKVLEHQIVASSPKLTAMLAHPAGPFTVHFWAPTIKWAISLANLADMRRSPETISVAQQTAVTATGLIWSRYSLIITPKNWNLFAVNVFMAGTGLVQFYRSSRTTCPRRRRPSRPPPPSRAKQILSTYPPTYLHYTVAEHHERRCLSG